MLATTGDVETYSLDIHTSRFGVSTTSPTLFSFIFLYISGHPFALMNLFVSFLLISVDWSAGAILHKGKRSLSGHPGEAYLLMYGLHWVDGLLDGYAVLSFG